MAGKQTEIATWFNNRIPVLCGPELPLTVPSKKSRPGLGLGTGKPIFSTTTPPTSLEPPKRGPSPLDL